MWNAKNSAVYLSKWWKFSEQYVLEAIDSDDTQQQLLAAVIAGYGGTTSRVEDVVAILVPHLMDNNIRGDSRIATPALYRIGPQVIPYLREQLLGADAQGKQILLHIIERLEYPKRSKSNCVHKLPFITATSSDPLTSPIQRAMKRF